MKVPVRIYVSETMLERTLKDNSLFQAMNVATLPGIQKYALVMPDMHEGYASPIGGVAAISATDGVISPGMQGYDINCLAGETSVLSEHGAYFKIKGFEKTNQNILLRHLSFKKQKLMSSPVSYFLKKYCNPHVLKIKTESGKEIKTTKDHPFLTFRGMKEAEFLKRGDKVVVYPFKGVKYVKPSGKIILSEHDFKNTLLDLGKTNRGSSISQILHQIKKLDIFPLRYSSWQLPYLLKIIGFVFGDGYISITKNKKAIIGFNGKPKDLELIRKDISKIGFQPYVLLRRERNHRIKTFYREYRFTTIESSFRSSSFAFAALLISLGVPYGLKTHRDYRVPKWICRCPQWQKRLFLASFFGAELSKPATLNKYNFCAPQFSVQKKEGLEKNARELIGDLKKLIKEFGVQVSETCEVSGYRYSGKQGRTKGFRLQIKGNSDNLVKFFESIGYEYNLEKQREACLAANYLRRKLKTVELRTKAREKIQEVYKTKDDFKNLADAYNNKYVSIQFLAHSVFKENRWGVRKKRGNPRISFNFPSFKEYKRSNSYGREGLVWDKIEKIETTPYADFVYDFTIDNENHNFVADGFVVSNCGVRLFKSNFQENGLRSCLDKLATEIQKQVPSGLGRGGQIKLSNTEIDYVLDGGAKYLVEKGFGTKLDLEDCEAGGRLDWAKSNAVSQQAKNRGRDQVGTLGSGNHFLEVQKVAEIFDESAARAFGLFLNQIVIMVHCGSRGLGHQVCTDYLREFIPLMEQKYKIRVPDREFACVPFNSPEGQKCLAASAAAANFAWANRQMITFLVRKAWKSVLGEKGENLTLLYDVAHNIIKREKYLIDGRETEVAVHRKGATRAFPPEHPEIPEKYRSAGQPVLIPGSMGTASYVLAGTAEGEQSFFSTCHGAGRTMSRHEAVRTITGEQVIRDLKSKGIIIKCQSLRGIAEEAPIAYKDVDEVVEVVHQAGLSKKVARLVPLAVIKGE